LILNGYYTDALKKDYGENMKKKKKKGSNFLHGNVVACILDHGIKARDSQNHSKAWEK
jgi:hypothetical protein